MTLHDEPLDDDIAALLRRGAPRPELPDDVHARLLRRAAASTVVTAGLFASVGASAKVGLASVVAVVVAGGVWTATHQVQQEQRPSTPTVVAMPDVPEAPAVAAPPLVVADIVAPTSEADAPLPAVDLVVAEAPRASPKRVVVDEVELLEQARVALGAGRYGAAEAALGQHRRQHPRGSLAEEREALTVVTLARKGDSARARKAQAAFHRRFAGSAFGGVVDGAI